MKLFWLIALTMTAFASNSVLNRLALSPGDTGPASYAAIRLVSGAIMLAVLVALRSQKKPKLSRHAYWSAAMLALYALGFSFAYITLPTGAGALILFGGVQVMSFAITLAKGQRISMFNWIGAGLAFAGLCYLLWPDEGAAIDRLGAGLMLIAALGWTLYTLAGAQSRDPLGATTLAFILAAPVGMLAWLIMPDVASLRGVLFAILSGAVTSGMGYALWYRVLPHLSMPIAAVAQLTVPVIAALGGAVFLGEGLTSRFAIATVMVLCGVGLSIVGQAMRK
ncbi:DMT family transporter [Planktotalea sp.]|uniref:DMT family transporter n=1 Tax=Planktotalea sp. TaxID=2029877 RepID=UPI003D6B149C